MKKIFLVGTGMVGMSFAYAALNQNLCDELVLCDINAKKARGEVQDLNHGLAFSKTSMKIWQGDYSQCDDADIIVICAGVNQKPEETRLQLLQRNLEIFKSIVKEIKKSKFNGIVLVATNPVDIMTRITQKLLDFDPNRVIGTGTTLDTARLRFLLGKYIKVDPRNVHAYVIGEHGDSEFVPWSQALIGTKPMMKVLEDNPQFSMKALEKISAEVRNSAYEIIKAKGATYYGVGMAICRLARAILQDENSILTVSSKFNNTYGYHDVYAGNPCIINNKGIDRTLELSLTQEEFLKLENSCNVLTSTFNDLSF